MRWRTAVGALCLALFVTGCAARGGGRAQPPTPAGAPQGLAQMTPQQFATFAPVVNRYFYYRKRAVVAQDVHALYREYPDLQHASDKPGGNAEAGAVARFRGLDVLDGNIQPEHYARLLVRQDGDQAAVLVDGLEVYLRKNFETTGGQLQLLLFRARRGDGWTVVKTDETTPAEYHQALHQ